MNNFCELEIYNIGLPAWSNTIFGKPSDDGVWRHILVADYNIQGSNCYDRNGALYSLPKRYMIMDIKDLVLEKDYFTSSQEAVEWVLQNKQIFLQNMEESLREKFMNLT